MTMKIFLLFPLVLLLAACTTKGPQQPTLHDYIDQVLDESGTHAGNDEYIRLLYESRTWKPYDQILEDSVEAGKKVKIPIQSEGVKLLGPTEDDALRSLALKIWMIENAEHTIDVVYYIFKTDLVGDAMLGALCNAVQRGVDVRIMVDSVGSISLFHTELMALESCAEHAGYMQNADGQPTRYKARIQTLVINALTRWASRANRRSHDKLLVMDGAFPDKAAVMTGGRNISLDYYGIKEDGARDGTAFRDLEMLLRPGAQSSFGEITVGNVSEIYFTLLSLHKGNKRLLPVYHRDSEDYVFFEQDQYRSERKKAQQGLEKLKSFPRIQQRMADMPRYMSSGFHESNVRLAHELANLTNKHVVTDTEGNLEGNPNSIMRLLDEFGDELVAGGGIRVVSPYIFIARYHDDEGNVIQDGVADALQWLSKNPQNKIEIITNSVLTSDNFSAQSIIDMDVGPRLLLTPEMEKAWLSDLQQGELNPQLVESEAWKKQVTNPQIFIYQTGKLDASVFGHGDREYGKLHAKFVLGDDIGFVGTANFDYRSRLFNNELGFFFQNKQVDEDLNAIFDLLKESSYRWGSPEWLQMRKEVMKISGMKGWSTRKQRSIFKFMRATGLDWLI